MLTSSRPFESRWYVDAICAASVGDSSAGRNATRNFTRRVSGISGAVASHASSQPVPHGVSIPSNPSASHAVAICARYGSVGRAPVRVAGVRQHVARVAAGGEEPVHLEHRRTLLAGVVDRSRRRAHRQQPGVDHHPAEAPAELHESFRVVVGQARVRGHREHVGLVLDAPAPRRVRLR